MKIYMKLFPMTLLVLGTMKSSYAQNCDANLGSYITKNTISIYESYTESENKLGYNISGRNGSINTTGYYQVKVHFDGLNHVNSSCTSNLYFDGSHIGNSGQGYIGYRTFNTNNRSSFSFNANACGGGYFKHANGNVEFEDGGWTWGTNESDFRFWFYGVRRTYTYRVNTQYLVRSVRLSNTHDELSSLTISVSNTYRLNLSGGYTVTSDEIFKNGVSTGVKITGRNSTKLFFEGDASSETYEALVKAITVRSLSSSSNKNTFSTSPSITVTGNTCVEEDDLDSDDDGILDVIEMLTASNGGDTDNDGIPDHLDLDSDNDGILDVVEVNGIDLNFDGIADGTPNEQGIPSSAGASGFSPINTDGVGAPDFQDLDSDNDGLSDLYESGRDVSVVDKDDNGVIDDGNDNDKDGVQDVIDNDSHGVDGYPSLKDEDNDNKPNYIDLDSNDPNNVIGDGNDDIEESGNGNLDTDDDGMINETTDKDSDGIDDSIDGDDSLYGELNAPTYDISIRAIAYPSIFKGDEKPYYTIFNIKELTQTTYKGEIKIGVTLNGGLSFDFDENKNKVGIFDVQNSQWEFLEKKNNEYIFKLKNEELTANSDIALGLQLITGDLEIQSFGGNYRVIVNKDINVRNNSDSEAFLRSKNEERETSETKPNPKPEQKSVIQY